MSVGILLAQLMLGSRVGEILWVQFLLLLGDTPQNTLTNSLTLTSFLILFCRVPWALSVGIFCGYIHWDWATQFWILIGCGFLQWFLCWDVSSMSIIITETQMDLKLNDGLGLQVCTTSPGSCGAGVGTQGSVDTRPAFYHLSFICSLKSRNSFFNNFFWNIKTPL